MDITITARHFKAHSTLREYAFTAIKKLERYYNGIVSADMILSYEKSINSVKGAELHVKVNGSLLKATEKSEDYIKSIDGVVEKLERQIQRHKSKERTKEKLTLRKVIEKE